MAKGRNPDEELEALHDRRAKDEEALKRKLQPPQTRQEQQAVSNAREADWADDN